MSLRSTLTAAVVAGSVAFAAGVVFSQEKEPSADELAKYMAERAAITDEHKRLARVGGMWETEGTFWNGPGEPETSKGSARFTPMLGGRFVVQEYSGTMMGKPFEGRAIEGYDKEKKKHFSIWLDNQGTGFLTSWGNPDATGKVYTYESGEEEWMGAKFRFKTIVTRTDDDHFKIEHFVVTAPGQDTKQMEILFTRRK